MARGWESKSVADQIEGAEERAARSRGDSTVSQEDRERAARIASLKMSRSRILDQLDKASRPAHRDMLSKALRSLERQLEELEIIKGAI
jgi:hypothetical protein